jgi:hypothetical protein
MGNSFCSGIKKLFNSVSIKSTCCIKIEKRVIIDDHSLHIGHTPTNSPDAVLTNIALDEFKTSLSELIIPETPRGAHYLDSVVMLE